ncbi:hypothetical protein WA026_011638 [Henosepilachna vigintioctopunctata]|uniref:Uncharacterized protein n=1 Tax=Henosepilachna vigintioctopunctata TaxID=420089 RepID=A0AAW1TSH6_9CUCU
MMESEQAEAAKTHTIYQKEWPVSEEDMIKSDSPHEEIIKICQSFENNQNVESVITEEKSDKIEIKEINEIKEICPDQYIINHNTLKGKLDGNVGNEYQHNKEVDEAVQSKFFMEIVSMKQN